MTVTPDPNALIKEWLDRLPDAARSYMHDAYYRAQIEWLRRLLNAADMAMAGEDVPPQTRARVLRSMMFGAPDEGAALKRIEITAQQIEKLTTFNPPPPPRWNASCRVDCELIPGYCTGPNGCLGATRS